MATKTIVTGYQEVTHILPVDLLDLGKLADAGGRVVEEFTVEVQRAKLETDYLVKISVPADKIEQFGGISVDYADGKWLSNAVKKEDHELTEEVEEPEPEILDAPEVLRDDPQRFVAKSDYESLIQATEVATTVKALKDVLQSYFALRAGL